jgi:hypothetical protein
MWRTTLFVFALGFLAWGRADGQTDSRLVAAVRLAQDGLPDSARAVVRRLLTTTDPGDANYGEMLYTAGLIAATEYDRRIALRRVIVEYASSAWADDALLLLAQVDYANGNPGATVAQTSRLLADYPASPLIPTAAFWGARAASDLRNGAEACRIADAGLTATTDDVELRNQLEYQKQRCTALVAQAGDSAARPGSRDSTVPVAPTPAPSPTPSPAPPPVAPVEVKGFRVQAIAAPTQAKADQTITALKGIGLDARTVREGGYFKVRIGPFGTKPEALKAMATIRARLGLKPFLVVDK